MKKILALVLTLAMVLSIGVASFATDADATFDEIALDGGDTIVIELDEGSGVLASKNGFTVVTKVATDNGKDYWLVKANATDVARTDVLTLTVGEGDAAVTTDYAVVDITPKTPAAPEVPDYDLGSEEVMEGGSFAMIQAGVDGFYASAYNEAKNMGKEKILIVGEEYLVVLYRGDYTKKNIDKDVLFDITATAWEIDNDLHNAVLDTLGNDKVDPLYIVSENNELGKVASKPEIKLSLSWEEDWLLNNGVKGLTLMSYTAKTEEAAASVAIVAEGLALDSVQNKFMTLSLTEAGVYFLLPAADAVVPEVPSDDTTEEEKPNASTGANDMAAAAIAFAVIAIAAGVSKKVK